MLKLNIAYGRLSDEDLKKAKDEQSKSIINQINYINHYAQTININIDKNYIDDGYSGINFDRPAFRQLKQDIEDGIIDTIITKDISRLGREYIDTIYYITEYFPQYNVRYIAIDDYYDSSVSDPEMVYSILGYKSIANDNFVKQTSIKVKCTNESKKRQKIFTGFIPPYGYKFKKIDNKKILIIDENVCDIVKRIFSEIANGKTRKEVAEGLNRDKIESPIVYLKMRVPQKKEYHYDWTDSAIYRILKNVTYTGNLFYKKSDKQNYKQKKRDYIKLADREIIKNTHEPIISEDLFCRANKQLKVIRGKTKTNYPGYFKEKVYCGQCGEKMIALKRERENNHIQYFFDCTTSINRKKCKCRTIADSKLKTIISSILKKLISEYVDENNVIDSTLKLMYKKENSKKKIDELKLSIESSNIKIKNLYLKKTAGEISTEEFVKQKNAESDFKEQNEQKLKTLEINSQNFQKREELIQKYHNFTEEDELFKNAVNELISKIYIYKSNDIKINFNFRKVDSEMIHLY